MRFQDAARDARAVVYAGIQADPLVATCADLLAEASSAQRVLARAAMNGQSTDAAGWRTAFPGLFGVGAPAPGSDEHDRSEAILSTALAVTARGEQVRSQVRGAIVEALTERLLARRVGPGSLHRERRILFDGVAAEIHPYDVTVERPSSAEAYDCKWGARGIGADVLNQLDDARRHAAEEGERLLVALVIFDARRSCEVRLARQSASREGIRLVSLEALDRLAGGRPPQAAAAAVPPSVEPAR
ncbi:MAG: hypothetical protein QOE42_2323 [Chloroflexota bacterium]|nr:hypothetical protein [Chloroflexota bacterium]